MRNGSIRTTGLVRVGGGTVHANNIGIISCRLPGDN